MNKISPNNILRSAYESITFEAETLLNLAQTIGLSFAEAVNLIHLCHGRIAVSGVGKSALIAKKIAATFNSINVPSIFIHAGDALHGDLGILSNDDIVIILSKSGETSEIRALLPALKSRVSGLIAIVANEGSFLAHQSDVVIHTPVEREADLNNLVPTASTMSQLAVGDALAVCLIDLKSFKSSDFALLHPAGMIGKRLYMKVSDLIGLHERPSVHEEAKVDEVIVEISSKRLGATGVLDERGKLCGVITDGDLRRMLEKKLDHRTLRASDIMSRNPKTIGENCKAVEALQTMREHNITQLLVLSDMEYVGVVHIHDLIREGF